MESHLGLKLNAPQWNVSVLVTFAWGYVSLKNVGSHDKSVKCVLLWQICAKIIALRQKRQKAMSPPQACKHNKKNNPLLNWTHHTQGCFRRWCQQACEIVAWDADPELLHNESNVTIGPVHGTNTQIPLRLKTIPPFTFVLPIDQ